MESDRKTCTSSPSLASERMGGRRVVFPSCTPTEPACLRSQSGPGSSGALRGCPTLPEYTLEPSTFRTILLSRLQMPLMVTERVCEGCGASLDGRGFHRTACTKSGRLKRRAVPLEKTTARICREAGANVRENVKLRDMNIAVAAGDERELEVLASGLPCRAGAQLAIDVTLRSPLTASGQPHARAAVDDGIVANSARADKVAKYPELVASRRCELIVLAIETSGRFSDETYAFLEELAYAKAREAAPVMRKSARLAWQRRWMRLLACTAARAWCQATTALAHQEGPHGVDGSPPELHEV